MNAPASDTALEQLVQTVERLNSMDSIQDAYRRFNIEPPPPVQSARWTRVEESEAQALASSTAQHFAAQTRIGKPGTDITDGRIEVEHNFRVRPYQARGRLGNPGLNEETYRVEPVVFKSINEISSLVMNASYDLHTPKDMPDSMVTEAKRQDRAIKRAMLRSDFLQNAAPSLPKHGFSFHEVRWERKNKLPYALEFREQATIERWLFDERQENWEATEFRTGGEANERYIIPNGDTIGTARTLLCNIHAQGHNLEGVSPTRVVVGIRKLKELILQTFGVSYQKYGVPIFTIIHELADVGGALQALSTAGEHKGEVQELIDRLENMRGRLAPVLPVPAGRRIESVNPTNEMPDPQPLLNYLDTMMAMVFANEGAMLGSQSFGSYAMADVSDRKFMRAAPAYAERIAYALTKLLHTGMRFAMPAEFAELEELPRYTFRFNGTQDSSRWLADLTLVMNAMAGSDWPEPVRQAAAARLGLAPDVFDDVGSITVDDPAPAPPFGEEE